MTKTGINLLARGQNSILGAMFVETDKDWLAVDPRDAEKMKDFNVYQILDITIGNDRGSYRFVEQADPNTWPIWDRIKWCLGKDLK